MTLKEMEEGIFIDDSQKNKINQIDSICELKVKRMLSITDTESFCLFFISEIGYG